MSDGDSAAPALARQQAEILDVLAGLVAVALLVLVFTDRLGAARIVLSVLFAFFVPGRAIVSNWPRMADWSGIGMSVALSIAALILLATISLWARIWHPLALFQIEAAASLIALGVAVSRRRRSPAAALG
jgi:uncharacterized membrane protein